MQREIRPITDRAQWLGWRLRDLTASRIAALFDAHPFLTRAGLAAQLRGSAKAFDNRHMRAGRVLEPGIASVAIAEQRPAWWLTKCTNYYRLPELRIGATPDYFVDDDGLVEITTIAPDEWNGTPPLYKVIQTHVQLLATDRARGCVAVMVRTLPELPLHLFDVSREPEVERCIIAAATAWWAAFERGEVAPAATWPHAAQRAPETPLPAVAAPQAPPAVARVSPFVAPGIPELEVRAILTEARQHRSATR